MFARTIHFESLEGRQLFSVASPAPSDPNDYHLLLADSPAGDTVVRNATSAQVVRPSQADGFKWFDSTTGADLADVPGSPFEQVVTDSYSFWPLLPGSIADRNALPSEARTRGMANYVAARHDVLIIDIENWALDVRFHTRPAFDQAIANYSQMLGWIRDEQPDLKIGIYGFMSHSDDPVTAGWQQGQDDSFNGSHWYRRTLPDVTHAYAYWQFANELMRSLSESVDYVYPTLYTGGLDQEHWLSAARATIDDSRRFGKPVIPFLQPYHHTAAGPGIGDTQINDAFWDLQLDTVTKYADGVVIWAAHNGDFSQASWVGRTVARALAGTTPDSGNGKVTSDPTLVRPSADAVRTPVPMPTVGFGTTVIGDAAIGNAAIGNASEEDADKNDLAGRTRRDSTSLASKLVG